MPHDYFEKWDRSLRILEQPEKILDLCMHGCAAEEDCSKRWRATLNSD
jgi:hypothetical protein